MKNVKAFIIMIIGCTLFSFQGDENIISAYLNQKEIAYEIICIQKGKEVWDYYTNSDYNDSNQSKILFTELFSDTIFNEKINKWAHDIDKIKDDTLKRRIEIWNNILTCAKVNFEPEINGIQSNLEKILADYPNVKFCDKEIEEEVLKLVRLRNEKSKELGYSNFAYLVLQNTGIDTVWFENLIQRIDESTISDYRQFLKRKAKKWNEPQYSDLSNELMKLDQLSDMYKSNDFDKKAQIEKILSNIGIDINTLPIQFQLTDLPPGIGGFGNAISIPDDFKAVAREELSFYYLLHEIGHGLQWTSVMMRSPVLKGYEWCMGNIPSLYYEAMAETVAKFSDNRTCLEQYGHTKDEIDSLWHLKAELRSLSLRYKLMNSLFEIELYKNPEKSPAAIKHDLFKKFLLVEKDFSARSHLIYLSYVSYPVYEQNYLIADILSTQIHEYLKNVYGDQYAQNPEVGAFLSANLWRNGEFIDWKQRIKQATQMSFYDDFFGK